MAVAYVSREVTTFNNSTGTVAYPASIGAGDLLVLINGHASDTFNVPSGFTEYGTVNSTAGTYHERRYFKIADGTESGNLTCTYSSSGGTLLTLMRFTGSFGPEPLSGIQYTANASSATTIVAPDTGAIASGSMAIAAAGAEGSATATTTHSANFTESSDIQQGAGGQRTQVVAYSSNTSPGSNTFTFTAAQINRLATSFVISERRSGLLHRLAA